MYVSQFGVTLWLTPLPTLQITQPLAPLVINGEEVPSLNGHAWVDAGLLFAGKDALEDRDISMWFDKNEAVAGQVVQLYGATITPRPCVVGWGVGAGGEEGEGQLGRQWCAGT